ncbi:MAG: hypothetical protein WC728_17120 [Elusimicrobiota bacterium]
MREHLLRLSVACARSLRALPAKPSDPRDLCFAAAGLLAAEESRALRRTLDGFRAGQGDGLFVWAACRYALRTDNIAWAGMAMDRLEQSLENDEPGEPLLARMLRWRALDSLAELCRAMGRARAAADWKSRAKRLIRETTRSRWAPQAGHFIEADGETSLRPEGNLAAAAWGFADEDASARILRTLDRLGWCTPWGPRSAQKTFLGGMRRTEQVQLWVSALELQALRRLRRRALLSERVERLSALVDAAGHVPDRCGADGSVESRGPSTRAAGMLLEACGTLLGSLDNMPPLA